MLFARASFRNVTQGTQNKSVVPLLKNREKPQKAHLRPSALNRESTTCKPECA
jgi:hypothetical protein